MSQDNLHIVKSVGTQTEQLKGLEAVTHSAIYERVAVLEVESLRRIVANGHESHDCPNGNCDDGHCSACMDRYWQTKGPELQNQVFALEQELATLRMWLVTFHEFMKTAPPAQREFGPSHISSAYMSEYLKSTPSPPP